MEIAPVILVPTFKEFKKQARRLEGIFDLAQIDVMDERALSANLFDAYCIFL
ncbi:MAG: hypothetical protein HYT36_00560 [Candidatus Staskawiczbacteria bacterium]|nr:hypothetical protein [Candidatus Staskawiczbacteria bacterium]